MKYFKMSEFECRDGCPMPASAKENIEALVEAVLDPAREKFGKPITVNSGYRCPRHNAAVGGVPGSQHMRGEAADVSAGSAQASREVGKIIEQLGKFDQLIYYPTFVHVSWKRIGKNRNQIIYKQFKA